MNPNNANAYFNRGNAFMCLKNFVDAIRNYDRAVELDPNYSSVYINRGFAYCELGNLTEAVTNYEQALEVEPNNPVALKNLNILRGKNI